MLGTRLDLDRYLDRLREEIARIDVEQVRRLADRIFEVWDRGRFVFLFGNGGSATTASHLAEDLGKYCLEVCDDKSRPAKRMKALSLTDNVGWITALANDLSYDRIFVEQLMHYASPGDLVLAISGSGNSPNVLRAVEWAKENGLRVSAMTGFDGGQLKRLADEGIHIQLDDMAMVESLHLSVAHWVIDDLHARITRQGRYQRADGSSEKSDTSR